MNEKQVLVNLSIVALGLLGAGAVFLWWLISAGGHNFAWLLTAIEALVLVFMLAGTAALAWLVMGLRRGYRLPQWLLLLLDVLFPLAMACRRILGYSKDDVRASFIAFHNAIVESGCSRVNPGKILVLAPVCLQAAECVFKITHDVDNCRRCGRCVVKDLLDLRDEYGFQLAIATGGTKARQLLRNLRPEAVIAIACERDLTSGIQESRGIRVIGIANQRPHGPCFNTCVDVKEVVRALELLAGRVPAS